MMTWLFPLSLLFLLAILLSETVRQYGGILLVGVVLIATIISILESR
jgi:hypothetical protein